MSKAIELLEKILEIEWAAEPSYDEWRGYHFTISADDRNLIVGSVNQALDELHKQPESENQEMQSKRNYIQDYLSKIQYRITTGTRDKEMDKFAEWLIESFDLINRQAEENKRLKEVVKIDVQVFDAIKNEYPNTKDLQAKIQERDVSVEQAFQKGE